MNNNFFFLDAFVLKIERIRDEYIKVVLRYQYSGGYSAGAKIKIREISLYFFEVEEVIGDLRNWNPGHCCDEIAIEENDSTFSMIFSLPQLLTIKFKLLKYEQIDRATRQKPYISFNDVAISFHSKEIPKPIFYLNKLEEFGEKDLTWRSYSSEKVEVQKVPLIDYSGWSIQQIDRLEKNLNGIFIFNISKKENTIRITMTLYDVSLISILLKLITIFSEFKDSEISFGNILLTGKQWQAFNKHKKLEYKGFTIEWPNVA